MASHKHPAGDIRSAGLSLFPLRSDTRDCVAAAFVSAALICRQSAPHIPTEVDLRMSTTRAAASSTSKDRLTTTAALAALSLLLTAGPGIFAQQPSESAEATTLIKQLPSLDLSSIDTTADPCASMYKFACGHFSANHPIPADQSSVDPFAVLYDVDTQELNTILQQAQAGSGVARTPDEQKIGDYFKACMDTSQIQSVGLAPIQPLLDRIDLLGSRLQLATLLGELQRNGVDVFFGYGEQQDLKDSEKQIAVIGQGGLGLPEKDYYLRTGEKDIKLREQYVAHIAKMLTLAGSAPAQAAHDAQNILALETTLAKASLGAVEMRDPEKTYHLQNIAEFTATLPSVNFGAFENAIHSPHVGEINNSTPEYIPVLLQQLRTADMGTIKAYLRYHLLSTSPRNLPKALDDENFDFYGRILEGQPQPEPRWKRCSNAVNGALGEALGKVYVERYFAGDSKAKTLTMVHDIEAAMSRDIDQIDWMSPATKVRAQEKLAAVTNKIGYPDKWRDYSSLIVKPDDPFGNTLRANQFENDRELNKIGKPVDHSEWPGRAFRRHPVKLWRA
jgi:putative endopeptidase